MVMRTPIVKPRVRVNGAERVDIRTPRKRRNVPALSPATIEWESERYADGIDLGDTRYL